MARTNERTLGEAVWVKSGKQAKRKGFRVTNAEERPGLVCIQWEDTRVCSYVRDSHVFGPVVPNNGRQGRPCRRSTDAGCRQSDPAVVTKTKRWDMSDSDCEELESKKNYKVLSKKRADNNCWEARSKLEQKLRKPRAVYAATTRDLPPMTTVDFSAGIQDVSPLRFDEKEEWEKHYGILEWRADNDPAEQDDADTFVWRADDDQVPLRLSSRKARVTTTLQKKLQDPFGKMTKHKKMGSTIKNPATKRTHSKPVSFRNFGKVLGKRTMIQRTPDRESAQTVGKSKLHADAMDVDPPPKKVKENFAIHRKADLVPHALPKIKNIGSLLGIDAKVTVSENGTSVLVEGQEGLDAHEASIGSITGDDGMAIQPQPVQIEEVSMPHATAMFQIAPTKEPEEGALPAKYDCDESRASKRVDEEDSAKVVHILSLDNPGHAVVTQDKTQEIEQTRGLQDYRNPSLGSPPQAKGWLFDKLRVKELSLSCMELQVKDLTMAFSRDTPIEKLHLVQVSVSGSSQDVYAFSRARCNFRHFKDLHLNDVRPSDDTGKATFGTWIEDLSTLDSLECLWLERIRGLAQTSFSNVTVGRNLKSLGLKCLACPRKLLLETICKPYLEILCLIDVWNVPQKLVNALGNSQSQLRDLCIWGDLSEELGVSFINMLEANKTLETVRMTITGGACVRRLQLGRVLKKNQTLKRLDLCIFGPARSVLPATSDIISAISQNNSLQSLQLFVGEDNEVESKCDFAEALLHLRLSRPCLKKLQVCGLQF